MSQFITYLLLTISLSGCTQGVLQNAVSSPSTQPTSSPPPINNDLIVMSHGLVEYGEGSAKSLSNNSYYDCDSLALKINGFPVLSGNAAITTTNCRSCGLKIKRCTPGATLTVEFYQWIDNAQNLSAGSRGVSTQTILTTCDSFGEAQISESGAAPNSRGTYEWVVIEGGVERDHEFVVCQ